jgi:hypothetical protein
MATTDLPRELVAYIMKFVGDAETLRACKVTSRFLSKAIHVHPSMQCVRCSRCQNQKRWRVTSNRKLCMTPKCQAGGLHFIVNYWTSDHRPLCSYGCLFL